MLMETMLGNTYNPYMMFAASIIDERDEMLNVSEFAERTNFEVKDFFIHDEWMAMNRWSDDSFHELTPSMMNSIGCTRPDTMLKNLKKMFPSNPNYSRNCDGEQYFGDGKNTLVRTDPSGKTSIMMTKSAIKEYLMESTNKAAVQTRRYYLRLEKLFVTYMQYQQAHAVVKAYRSKERDEKKCSVVACSSSFSSPVAARSSNANVISPHQTDDASSSKTSSEFHFQPLFDIEPIAAHEYDFFRSENDDVTTTMATEQHGVDYDDDIIVDHDYEFLRCNETLEADFFDEDNFSLAVDVLDTRVRHHLSSTDYK